MSPFCPKCSQLGLTPKTRRCSYCGYKVRSHPMLDLYVPQRPYKRTFLPDLPKGKMILMAVCIILAIATFAWLFYAGYTLWAFLVCIGILLFGILVCGYRPRH